MSSRSVSTPQVHQIKAIFEGYRHVKRPTQQSPRVKSYSSQTNTDDLTMQNTQTDRTLLPAERPKLSQKPSWVGRPPLRSAHTDDKAMTQRVVIRYAAPELNPPVYITTSLSEPEWDIIEMEATQTPSGWSFHKSFDVAVGEYQYKFRLGPGDWWVCDESLPTIDDGDGNRNNVLVVVKDEFKHEGHTPAPQIHPSSSVQSGAQSSAEEQAHRSAEHNHIASINGQAESTSNSTLEHEAPLMKHEASYPGQVDEILPVLSSPTTSSSSKSAIEEIICLEADLNQPNLPQFPTHHAGIVEELRRAQQKLPEDIIDEHPASPIHRQTSSLQIPALPLVQEDIEEIMVVVSSDDESSVKHTKHRHDGSHHHGHNHTQPAATDMQEEGKINDRKLHKKSTLAELGEVFFGITFAAVVLVVAVVLYSTGLTGFVDTTKDGGAAIA